VRAGRSNAPDGFPRDPEQAELVAAELFLEVREQHVLFIPNVVEQQPDHLLDQGCALRRARRRTFQNVHELIDLLVFALHLQGEVVAVRHDPADHRPEHRFFGEGVREDEAEDLEEDCPFLPEWGLPELLQQLIQPNVIQLLATEHAQAAAEILDALLGK
jgi:hypothetical protein